MKFQIEMNLSPDGIDVLTAEGWEARESEPSPGAT